MEFSGDRRAQGSLSGSGPNAEPGDLLLDVTALWAALRGVERDPETGSYPVRVSDDPGLRMALYVRAVGVRFASENELDGWATTSSSDPEAVERLRAAGAVGRVVTVDPGESVVRRRLADPITGELSVECERAIGRWY